MNSIGVVTFHNGSNYGAALQTYALQEAIKEYNKNVQIINYDNRFISKGLNTVRFDFSLRGLYFTIMDLLYYKSRAKKIENFKKFFSDYYNMSDLVTKKIIQEGGIHFDIGISGSDQIWNPLLNNGIDRVYFLDFPGIKKKNSYASSIGSYKFDNDAYNGEIYELLKSYQNISVRESSQRLSDCIHREVEEVCDPTLLLTKEDWERGLELKINNEHYLLIYAMTDFENITKYAIEMAKLRGLKVKYIGMPVKKSKKIEYIVGAGPREFVSLFYNADYIVTNSFHGTAFSVNFEKQFVSLINPKNPERAEFFLNSIGLAERLVDHQHILFDDISDEKYTEVKCRLMQRVADSRRYLERVLEIKNE